MSTGHRNLGHKNNVRKTLPPAAELLRMHVEDGLSYAEIGKEYGCSRSIVSERVHDSGLLDKPLLKPSATLDLRQPVPSRAFMFSPAKACADVDPALFFPTRGGRDATKAAKALCARCPFKDECLEWAVTHYEVGVWGATTAAQRRKIRRERAAGLQAAS